ncbi:MAG: YbaK/EbsC family protein [Cryobacterium sp.]|nr:YbaK/EbsC family protein [Cryobacterium sp.]
MADAVTRFIEAAEALGFPVVVKNMDQSTHTALEAANAVGCEVGAIVKSLIFEADGSPILILTSGPNRVDTALLGQELGVKLGKADANAVKEVTGFSIGGVPPFGHKSRLKTVIDSDLLRYEKVWAAAGAATSVFEISPDDLIELSQGVVARVC